VEVGWESNAYCDQVENKYATQVLATTRSEGVYLQQGHEKSVVKVDRRIRWHYTTTILCLRIGARLTRYRTCKFHNFARTISRHADGISRYSVPPSAGPLLPLRKVTRQNLFMPFRVNHRGVLRLRPSIYPATLRAHRELEDQLIG